MRQATYFLCLCSIIFLNFSFSHNTPETNRELDSLNEIISNKSSHDTSIVRAYLDIGMVLYLNDIDTLKSQCQQAIKLIDESLKKRNSKVVETTLKRIKADALISIGYVEKYHGNISEGLKYYKAGLKLNQEIDDKIGIGNANINLGVIYMLQGDISMCLECYSIALKNYELVDYEFGLGYVYNHIGSIHYQQKDYNLAIQNFNKSLKFREALNDTYGMSTTYTNLGSIKIEQGDYTAALKYYEDAQKLRIEIGDKDGIANSYMSLGKLFDVQSKSSIALEYYFKGHNLYKEVNDDYRISHSMVVIGNVYLKKGNYSEAKVYGEKAMGIARKLGFPDNLETAAKLLSTIYSHNGNYKLALEMRNLEILMSDSLKNESAIKAAAKQETKYKYEKDKAADSIVNAEANKVKDALLSVEQQENEKNRAEAEKQAQQKYYLFGILALAIIFGGVVLNRFRTTKKQKLVIESQKETVDKAFEELEEKNTEIMDSISYAKRIQNAILPSKKLIEEHLASSFVHYKPKDIVAGDFYWMEPTKSGVLFAAADCTGHGVPGAMVSVVCNNGLNRSVREYGLTDPAQILDKTREIVIEEFEKSEDEVKDGMDIALCKLSGNTLEYAGSNNPLWIIRKDGTVVEEIKANKQPIGKFIEPVPYITKRVELNPGDSFYIFSDGYPDQFGGEKGKKFKSGNFKKLLLSIQNKSMSDQESILCMAFEDWRGSLEQIDDVCIIGVRV
jgi:serine phosphatase RsbU (regulator of sigma subunit)